MAMRKRQPRCYPSGSPLKDDGSPTKPARSQPRRVFTLTAARVSQQPISSPTLMVIRKRKPLRLSLGKSPERRELPTKIIRSRSRQVFTLTATQVGQVAYIGSYSDGYEGKTALMVIPHGVPYKTRARPLRLLRVGLNRFSP